MRATIEDIAANKLGNVPTTLFNLVNILNALVPKSTIPLTAFPSMSCCSNPTIVSLKEFTFAAIESIYLACSFSAEPVLFWAAFVAPSTSFQFFNKLATTLPWRFLKCSVSS